MAKHFLIGFILALLASCGTPRGTRAGNDAHPAGDTSQTVARVKEFVHNTPECSSNPGASACQLVEVRGQRFNYNDTAGQRILIIEGDLLLPSMGRYRNRVRGRYGLTRDGSYVPREVSVRMPQGLSYVWHTLLGEDKTFIPASALEDVRDEFQRKFTVGLNAFPVEHASPILSILAEYTPGAAFYLAAYPEGKDLVCSRNYLGLRRYFKTAGDSLTTIVHAEGIRYINLSIGYTRGTVREFWSANCRGSLDERDIDMILDAVALYYKAVASIEGAVLVQAGLSSGVDANEMAPIDCNTEGYRNRLRIGFFNDATTVIAAGGRSLDDSHSLLSGAMQSAAPCLDLFVNSGLSPRFPFPPGAHALRLNEEGIGTYAIPAFATSYAAPVALAHLVWLTATEFGGRTFDDSVVAELLSRASYDGERPVQDPLQNHALERFRLEQ